VQEKRAGSPAQRKLRSDNQERARMPRKKNNHRKEESRFAPEQMTLRKKKKKSTKKSLGKRRSQFFWGVGEKRTLNVKRL